jgi:hypothetical protein
MNYNCFHVANNLVMAKGRFSPGQSLAGRGMFLETIWNFGQCGSKN